ncbi:serine acetyltransferase [mine drainage metagenome]|uniref:Serine acetyltransferase n=1 Tax=mine drainage metagenome TaxID=410659 RepID=A0A1J5RCS2_9ZZZZ
MTYCESGFWRADVSRYPKRGWLNQPALWAIGVYRFGRWSKAAPPGIRALSHGVYFVFYSIVRLATGVDIPRSAQIGPGLMIHHYGGIIVSPLAIIGSNCTMRQGVTIGSKIDGGAVPVLGDGVALGAYAQVLGDVRVGSCAVVGAMAVVLADVPEGGVAVGIPARVVRVQSEEREI